MSRRSRLHGSASDLMSRKQLSMVLPLELIEAIKQRASEQGLTITAYVAELVRRDLGWPTRPDVRSLAEQFDALEQRVERLEHQDQSL